MNNAKLLKVLLQPVFVGENDDGSLVEIAGQQVMSAQEWAELDPKEWAEKSGEQVAKQAQAQRVQQQGLVLPGGPQVVAPGA